MAKKNKNKIFEQQIEEEKITDAILEGADEAKESMVENVPDDPSQMDLLNDKLSQISQLTAELNIAKQKIIELEMQIEKLQADNDQLIMKLADTTAKATECIQIPLKIQLPSGTTATVNGKTTDNVVSKRVNYIHTKYNNNGYGTWN